MMLMVQWRDDGRRSSAKEIVVARDGRMWQVTVRALEPDCIDWDPGPATHPLCATISSSIRRMKTPTL